jgi:hypothetical protein
MTSPLRHHMSEGCNDVEFFVAGEDNGLSQRVLIIVDPNINLLIISQIGVIRSKEPEHISPQRFKTSAHIYDDLAGNAVSLIKKPKQKMLGSDYLMVQFSGILFRETKNQVSSRRDAYFVRRRSSKEFSDLRRRPESFDFGLEALILNTSAFEGVGSDAGAFSGDSKQKMLGSDVFAAKQLRRLIGKGEDMPRPVGHFDCSSCISHV